MFQNGKFLIRSKINVVIRHLLRFQQFGNSVDDICYEMLTKDFKMNILLPNYSISYKDHIDLTIIEKDSARDFYFNYVNHHVCLH